MMTEQGKHRVAAFLTFLTISAATAYLHYPFFLTGDSWIWLGQARGGNWSNIQPIGAIALWSVLDRVYPGPLLFVLLNICLVVGGIVLIVFRSVRGKLLGFLVVSACVFYPITFSILGLAWRDITGLGLVLLAVAALTFALGSSSLRMKALVVAVVAAIGVVGPIFRYNDAAGMLPVLATAVYLVLPPSFGLRRRVAASLVGTFAFLTLATLCSMGLANQLASEDWHLEQVRLNQLLARLSVEVGQNLMPEEIYPDLDLEEMERLMSAYRQKQTGIYLAFWTNDNPRLPRLTEERQVEILRFAYRRAKEKYPMMALKSRLRIIRDVIVELPNTERYVDFFSWRSSFPVAYPYSLVVNFDVSPPHWARTPLRIILPAVAWLLPGHPIFYLVVAALASFAAFRLSHPARVVIAILTVSATAHYAAVFLLAFHYENRYGHQTVVLCLLASLLFLSELVSRRSVTRSQETNGRIAALSYGTAPRREEASATRTFPSG